MRKYSIALSSGMAEEKKMCKDYNLQMYGSEWIKMKMKPKNEA